MCGEQTLKEWETTHGEGSSPRVRGAVVSKGVSGIASGIIPACAGSSYVLPYYVWQQRDHPRVCGEQQVWWGFGKYKGGSSPRVRGAVP